MIKRFFGGRAAALALVTLAFHSIGSTAPARGQGGDGSMRGFLLVGDYRLVVDGKEVTKAEVYKSSRAASVLLISPDWESPVLLTPARGAVDAVNLLKVSRINAEAIDLLPGAVFRSLGTYRMAEEDIVFTAFGKVSRLEPRPWLLKLQTGAKMLEHDASYQRRANAYPVDAAVLNELKKQTRSARVLVFFGSWCPHCQMNLPKILKLEKELAGAGNVKFDYYGLPKGTEFSTDAEVQRYKIDSVPTGVVLVDGKEIGRLDGDGWVKIETTLRDLLKKPA